MHIRNMALCALFAALLSVCAWLAIPLGDIYITLQTFGVFLCLATLGGKRGSIAVLVYLLLGALGLPVFSGFRGGLGALLSTTGGYLTGFLACALVYWLLTALLPRKTLLALVVGLLVCYCFGTIWYYNVYIQSGSAASLWLIVSKCVLPYLLPDGAKLVFALTLAKKLRPFIFRNDSP